MPLSIAHLGPAGTYAEQAAIAYARWWAQRLQQPIPALVPAPSIAQALIAVVEQQTDLAIVPIENSIEGSVTMTLDTLWEQPALQIRQAVDLPIAHVLVTRAPELAALQRIYSHPQALGQCRQWLTQQLPQVQLIPTNSTTEALKYVEVADTAGAIASARAADLYNLPILYRNVQDHPDNRTRFLVVCHRQTSVDIPDITSPAVYTSLAFSLPQNSPGALLAPLKIFAARHINLSRIESRPSKKSLGDYVFFIDATAPLDSPELHTAIDLLQQQTEILKVFGDYVVIDPAANPETSRN